MAIVCRLNIENMLTTKYSGGGGAIIQGAAKPSLLRRDGGTEGLEIALKYSRQHSLPFPCPPQTQTLNICRQCQYQCQFLETSKLPNTHLKR